MLYIFKCPELNKLVKTLIKLQILLLVSSFITLYMFNRRMNCIFDFVFISMLPKSISNSHDALGSLFREVYITVLTTRGDSNF